MHVHQYDFPFEGKPLKALPVSSVKNRKIFTYLIKINYGDGDYFEYKLWIKLTR